MAQGPPDGSAETGLTPDDESNVSTVRRILFNRRVVKIVGILIVIGLLLYAFFVVLPSEVDWSEVWADIQALSAAQIVALVAAGLLSIVALGWTSKASLPGLTLYQGTESSATSQLTAFAFPPPADMAVRFSMYRTYGFDDEQSAVAVLIATVARYAMVFFMPLVGMFLVLVTGQASWTAFWWFLGFGIAFLAVMWLIVRTARSPAAAHTTGRWLQRVATRVIRFFHRTPPTDLEESVVKFGSRTRATIDHNGLVLVVSNLTWGLSNALIMTLAMRFCDLSRDVVTPTAVILSTGLVMAINMLPIPGKDALVASGLAALLGLTTTADINAVSTALILYRLITWILPMPVGGVTFLAWRYRVRRDKVTTIHPESAN